MLGAGALLSSLWVNWFEVYLGGFEFNLGWPALIYAGILSARNVVLRPQLQLTPRELHDWGKVLEEETGRIVDLYGAGTSTREIAERLHALRGIPLEVTLKYIIAVARYQKKNPKEAEDKG
ncbi:MAG: hypothetical protein ABIK09_04640 [Pseudomonadota bacterium]